MAASMKPSRPVNTLCASFRRPRRPAGQAADETACPSPPVPGRQRGAPPPAGFQHRAKRRAWWWRALAAGWLAALAGCGLTKAPAPAPEIAVIDTRSEREFRAGHVRGAIHIPHDRVRAMRDRLPDDKSTPLVVHCAVGVRAALAVRALESLGYHDIRNVGGLNQLADAGWPLVEEGGGAEVEN